VQSSAVEFDATQSDTRRLDPRRHQARTVASARANPLAMREQRIAVERIALVALTSRAAAGRS
jgi:hypothetical protein